MNMKMNFSMDEIRLKVEEYIKKGSRAAGRPVLTAYYVLTADSTPESDGKSSVSCPLKPSDSAPLKHSTMPP